MKSKTKITWTDQKPFVVDEEIITLPWAGKRDGSRFGCAFCLTDFKSGDTARWVFTETGPNIFVCPTHDTPDVQERWTKFYQSTVLPILKRWGWD